MGKPNGTAADEAVRIVAGTFTATGNSAGFLANSDQDFNVTVWGVFSATIALTKSYDGGTTYVPVARDTLGTAATFTGPMTFSVREPESGCLYRLEAQWTSGTVSYRISQ